MSVFFFSLFPDVNECKNNVHNRDGNPFCSNSAGSYNCTCSPGYTGNLARAKSEALVNNTVMLNGDGNENGIKINGSN